MEKSLSVSQCDQIYLRMAKDKLILKQTLMDQLTATTAEFKRALDKMTTSIENVGKSIGASNF